MPNDSLFFSTIPQLARRLRAGKISSLELTRRYLDRLRRLGPRYHALAELTESRALAAAGKADQKLRRGRAPSLLTGIPYGAKDLLAATGAPTRWGAPPYRDQVFDYDATVIERLDAAGAVLVGKLAMVELAGGGGYEYANASLHGPGLNPWNPAHWSGGSSSGSASAVAAGLVPYALGSETWGSIMCPSSFCGITGLRPTWGRVSRHGAMELAWTMDKIGPMAHTAEDCGLVLEAIAGRDPHDLTTTGAGFVFQRRIREQPLTVGVLPSDFEDIPEMGKAFETALRVLRRSGVRLKETRLPEHPYGEVAVTLLDGEQAAAHEEFIKSDRLDELVDDHQKKGLRDSLAKTAAAHVRAEKVREQMTSDVLALFDKFDALVSPSYMFEANRIEQGLSAWPRRRGNYSVLGALCGLPALSVPMGFGAQGLPLGLCFTGDLFEENTILQLGMRFQRETGWHALRPPAPPES